ncbi:hypothetical protein FN846DRAFT_123499 [Sphaerosporella brunnea]|uniref:Uncharacterized protein n=1 Tax=Sphaerosporella brunnea TaxID=1250544 RepID=A0A5J5ERE2_9PEZI|nr:hypothetical protein FN846DRAFT_957562 [Sphaerosporella brunnea]KAA8901317.1 hypothetical protein FN846DRAFT_123499 [Sphaerosporella brunnea]
MLSDSAIFLYFSAILVTAAFLYDVYGDNIPQLLNELHNICVVLRYNVNLVPYILAETIYAVGDYIEYTLLVIVLRFVVYVAHSVFVALLAFLLHPLGVLLLVTACAGYLVAAMVLGAVVFSWPVWIVRAAMEGTMAWVDASLGEVTV